MLQQTFQWLSTAHVGPEECLGEPRGRCAPLRRDSNTFFWPKLGGVLRLACCFMGTPLQSHLCSSSLFFIYIVSPMDLFARLSDELFGLRGSGKGGIPPHSPRRGSPRFLSLAAARRRQGGNRRQHARNAAAQDRAHPHPTPQRAVHRGQSAREREQQPPQRAAQHAAERECHENRGPRLSTRKDTYEAT